MPNGKPKRSLPRLLYVGDVPVESSYHGSALLHRLLKEYPPERLTVLEAVPWVSNPSRRLSQIPYFALRIGISRLLRSRFARAYGSWIIFGLARNLRRLSQIAAKSKPEAILTIAHGYSWLMAAEFAIRHHLPFHLILHDDWLSSVPMLSISRRQAAKLFCRYYRAAASRFCVSPAMIERYRDKCGVDGVLLYPSQARAAASSAPLGRKQNPANATVFAYAGTLTNRGYARAIVELANITNECGGKILIYGPVTQDHAAALGLTSSNIVLRGLVSSEDLINELREVADILFLPMSFDSTDRTQMELCFPSKLTDYTSTGLPILIYGPPYCSAIRWVHENPGIAETVETNSTSVLRSAAQRLLNDQSYRLKLGERAREAGSRYFSYENAARAFYGALSQSS